MKGKLRSLLARQYGSIDVNKDSEVIKEIFGDAPTKENNQKGKITRLLVRDAFLHQDTKSQLEKREGKFSDLELDYTETKWENTIDRKSGTAQNPRQLERVPAGSLFNFELVYSEYDDNKTDAHLTEIKKAMSLLEDDYLGGSGSRGYGKIIFKNVKYEHKTIDIYASTNVRQPYSQ